MLFRRDVGQAIAIIGVKEEIEGKYYREINHSIQNEYLAYEKEQEEIENDFLLKKYQKIKCFTKLCIH